MRLCLVTGLVVSLLLGSSLVAMAEEETEVLATSPSGAFRIESKFPDQSAADATADIWVISTKDPAQRAKLPKQSADSPTDDEFHFSPNEEWLFGSRHVGSGLRYGNIYHLRSPLRIEAVGEPGSFNDLVWQNAVKLGALKKDYAADGLLCDDCLRELEPRFQSSADPALWRRGKAKHALRLPLL